MGNGHAFAAVKIYYYIIANNNFALFRKSWSLCLSEDFLGILIISGYVIIT